MPKHFTIGIVAGELSGDSLGGGLMESLRAQYPDSEFTFLGIGGPKMLGLGLESLEKIDNLSMNGFREPILRLPYLIRLLRFLVEQFRARKIDAFLGVDFNVFNFLIEKILHKRNIPTAHYVSPSVYAWRPGRAKKVARSTDLLFCLFPFEPQFYRSLDIEAHFVGHPLADINSSGLNFNDDKEAVRNRLRLPKSSMVVALLPGSRKSEIDYMLDTFLETSRLLKESHKTVSFIVPCVSEAIQKQIDNQIASANFVDVSTYVGDAKIALFACDVVLAKSGTVTLEAALIKRPMVVAYKLGRVTHFLLRFLVKSRYFALPNLVLDKELVPEFIQQEATPDNLCAAVLRELKRFENDPGYLEGLESVCDSLRKNANVQAAKIFHAFLEARVK